MDRISQDFDHIFGIQVGLPNAIEFDHGEVEQESLELFLKLVLGLEFFMLLGHRCNAIYDKKCFNVRKNKHLAQYKLSYLDENLLKSLRWSKSCYGSLKPIISGSRMVSRAF